MRKLKEKQENLLENSSGDLLNTDYYSLWAGNMLCQTVQPPSAFPPAQTPFPTREEQKRSGKQVQQNHSFLKTLKTELTLEQHGG